MCEGGFRDNDQPGGEHDNAKVKATQGEVHVQEAVRKGSFWQLPQVHHPSQRGSIHATGADEWWLGSHTY